MRRDNVSDLRSSVLIDARKVHNVLGVIMESQTYITLCGTVLPSYVDGKAHEKRCVDCVRLALPVKRFLRLGSVERLRQLREAFHQLGTK